MTTDCRQRAWIGFGSTFVIILPDAFASGSGTPSPRPNLDLQRESNMFRGLVEAVRTLDTFVIATLEKDVDLTLFGLALACDYRIAAEDAMFVNRFLDRNVSAGLLPWFLCRFMDPGHATEFLLRGKIMTAEESLKLGLVNQLVAPEAFQTQVLTIAEEFANKPANALIAIKRGLIASFDDLGTYLDRVGTGFEDRWRKRLVGSPFSFR